LSTGNKYFCFHTEMLGRRGGKSAGHAVWTQALGCYIQTLARSYRQAVPRAVIHFVNTIVFLSFCVLNDSFEPKTSYFGRIASQSKMMVKWCKGSFYQDYKC